MRTRRWGPVTALAMLVVVLVVGLVSAGGPPAAPPGLERAIAAQEALTDRLMAQPGVVGTAVGLSADGQPVVKIYTESAGVPGLPRRLDGVPVEVEVTGEIVAQSLARPAPIGVSSGSERLIVYRGHLYCTAGTLGARVKDSANVYALSAAHVYALEGSKPDGTVQAGVNGDRILQPGRVDMTDQACGSQQEIDTAVIGNLWSYVPIVLSRRAENTVDAAIALVSTEQVGNATPADGYGTPASAALMTATLGLSVQKYGQATGLTKGTVTGVNATVIVRYDKGQARFVGQIVIQGSEGSFSAGGDSGSLIVTQETDPAKPPIPVALLFAGSSSSTIGNPIDLVLSAFGVTIDGTP